MSDVDQAAFRRAAGQFPGGIVVVTTSAGHAMTVSAFASVSLEPPLVLFCAEKIARFHDAVLADGAWAVSILAEDGEKTAPAEYLMQSAIVFAILDLAVALPGL